MRRTATFARRHWLIYIKRRENKTPTLLSNMRTAKFYQGCKLDTDRSRGGFKMARSVFRFEALFTLAMLAMLLPLVGRTQQVTPSASASSAASTMLYVLPPGPPINDPRQILQALPTPSTVLPAGPPIAIGTATSMLNALSAPVAVLPAASPAPRVLAARGPFAQGVPGPQADAITFMPSAPSEMPRLLPGPIQVNGTVIPHPLP